MKGDSTAPADGGELVVRFVVVQQGPHCYAGPADGGMKGWNAALDTPDLTPGDVVATGSETYMLVDDGSPVFRSVTWIQQTSIETG